MVTEKKLRKSLDPTAMTKLEWRFWTKVRIVDDRDSCWEWDSYRNDEPENYGKFKWLAPGRDKGSSMNASRVAFFLIHGYLPPCVRHTCDNPPCARPSHLVAGTHAENMTDKRIRGRGRTREDQRGEKNDSAVLTDDVVRRARILYIEGSSYKEIAAELEVPETAVGFAVRGRSWGHIEDVPPVAAEQRRLNGGKLTPAQVETIKAARAAGDSCKALAEEYGVTPSNISFLTRDKTKPSRKKLLVPLSDDQVHAIRKAIVEKVKQKEIAAEHGISAGLVSHIATGRAYGHVSTS